jgi:hypothetical protein
MKRLAGQVARAIESHPGQPMATEGIGAATLAWEMATLAQSCAYLAEEAQIWAQHSVDRTLTSPDLIYRQLLDSVGTTRRLLDIMHRRLGEINRQAPNNGICVLNVHLAEEIRYMLGLGLATTTVECMTNIESPETSSTADAGDTK